MSKLCEDFIEGYSEYLKQTYDVISNLGNGEYNENEISSVTRMLINQATLTIKTQELLLVMLERVDKICDALEVRNETGERK
jgi:hypothetical protein